MLHGSGFTIAAVFLQLKLFGELWQILQYRVGAVLVGRMFAALQQ
jgi:hypothetical protein